MSFETLQSLSQKIIELILDNGEQLEENINLL
jgi:hypothetical protein